MGKYEFRVVCGICALNGGSVSEQFLNAISAALEKNHLKRVDACVTTRSSSGSPKNPAVSNMEGTIGPTTD